MGGDSAGYAVGMIDPKYVIPAHYGVFDTMDQTPDAFLEALRKHAPHVEAIVLEPGRDRGVLSVSRRACTARCTDGPA